MIRVFVGAQPLVNGVVYIGYRLDPDSRIFSLVSIVISDPILHYLIT